MTEAGSLLVYSTVSDEPTEPTESEAEQPSPDRAEPLRLSDRVAEQRALSESTLDARARDGDVDAFASLVRTHEAELVRLAYRMLGDRDAAEAVALETLRGVWRRHTHESEPAPFRVMLSRTVVRRCLTLAARTAAPSARVTSRLTDDRAAGRRSAEDCAEVDLETALASLSPEERACWVLKELHSLSEDDIAFAMSVSSGTVSHSITRARRRLIAEVGSV